MALRVLFKADQVVVRSKPEDEDGHKGGFMRVDRGVVEIVATDNDEHITFYDGEGNKMNLQIEVSNIVSYKRFLVHNKTRSMVKGMTTFYLQKPVEYRAKKESYSLIMDVKDHDRLHSTLGQA